MCKEGRLAVWRVRCLQLLCMCLARTALLGYSLVTAWSLVMAAHCLLLLAGLFEFAYSYCYMLAH